MEKKALNYSALTDKVYYIDGRGKKTDLTENFMNILTMMVLETPKGFSYRLKGGITITVSHDREEIEK